MAQIPKLSGGNAVPKPARLFHYQGIGDFDPSAIESRYAEDIEQEIARLDMPDEDKQRIRKNTYDIIQGIKDGSITGRDASGRYLLTGASSRLASTGVNRKRWTGRYRKDDDYYLNNAYGVLNNIMKRVSPYAAPEEKKPEEAKKEEYAFDTGNLNKRLFWDDKFHKDNWDYGNVSPLITALKAMRDELDAGQSKYSNYADMRQRFDDALAALEDNGATVEDKYAAARLFDLRPYVDKDYDAAPAAAAEPAKVETQNQQDPSSKGKEIESPDDGSDEGVTPESLIPHGMAYQIESDASEFPYYLNYDGKSKMLFYGRLNPETKKFEPVLDPSIQESMGYNLLGFDDRYAKRYKQAYDAWAKDKYDIPWVGFDYENPHIYNDNHVLISTLATQIAGDDMEKYDKIVNLLNAAQDEDARLKQGGRIPKALGGEKITPLSASERKLMRRQLGDRSRLNTKNFSDADMLRASSLLADAISLGLSLSGAGSSLSAATGFGATALNQMADINEGMSFGQSLGNNIFNYGMDALSILPFAKLIKVPKMIKRASALAPAVIAALSGYENWDKYSGTWEKIQHGGKDMTAGDWKNVAAALQLIVGGGAAGRNMYKNKKFLKGSLSSDKVLLKTGDRDVVISTDKAQKLKDAASIKEQNELLKEEGVSLPATRRRRLLKVIPYKHELVDKANIEVKPYYDYSQPVTFTVNGRPHTYKAHTLFGRGLVIHELKTPKAAAEPAAAQPVPAEPVVSPASPRWAAPRQAAVEPEAVTPEVATPKQDMGNTVRPPLALPVHRPSLLPPITEVFGQSVGTPAIRLNIPRPLLPVKRNNTGTRDFIFGDSHTRRILDTSIPDDAKGIRDISYMDMLKARQSRAKQVRNTEKQRLENANMKKVNRQIDAENRQKKYVNWWEQQLSRQEAAAKQARSREKYTRQMTEAWEALERQNNTAPRELPHKRKPLSNKAKAAASKKRGNNSGYVNRHLSGGLIMKFQNPARTISSVAYSNDNDGKSWYKSVWLPMQGSIVADLKRDPSMMDRFNGMQTDHRAGHVAAGGVWNGKAWDDSAFLKKTAYSDQTKKYQDAFNTFSTGYGNTLGIASAEKSGRYNVLAGGNANSNDNAASKWANDGFWGAKTNDRTFIGKVGDITPEELELMRKAVKEAGVDIYDKDGYYYFKRLAATPAAPQATTQATPSASEIKTYPPGYGAPKTGDGAIASTTPSEGLKPNWGELLGAGRLAGTILTNNAIARTMRNGLAPLLRDPVLIRRQVVGDLPTRTYMENMASEAERIGARPVTSDASLALGQSLDYNTRAGEYRTKGWLADKEAYDASAKSAQEAAESNVASRVDAANKNRASMLSIRQAKANLEAQRKSANWAQGVAPWLLSHEMKWNENEKLDRELAYNESDWAATQRYKQAVSEARDALDARKKAWLAIDGNDEDGWLSSDAYKEASKDYTKAANTAYDAYRQAGFDARRGTYRYRPFLFFAKSGGRLTFGERAELDHAKDVNRAFINDRRLFHKMIADSQKENNKLILSLSGLSKELIINALKP